MTRLIVGFGLAIAIFAWPASGEAGHPYGWSHSSSWGGNHGYGNPYYPQGPHWGSSPHRSWGSSPYGAFGSPGYGSPGYGSSWPNRPYDRSRWFFAPGRDHHRHGHDCDRGQRFHDRGSGFQFRFR